MKLKYTRPFTIIPELLLKSIVSEFIDNFEKPELFLSNEDIVALLSYIPSETPERSSPKYVIRLKDILYTKPYKII